MLASTDICNPCLSTSSTFLPAWRCQLTAHHCLHHPLQILQPRPNQTPHPIAYQPAGQTLTWVKGIQDARPPAAWGCSGSCTASPVPAPVVPVAPVLWPCSGYCWPGRVRSTGPELRGPPPEGVDPNPCSCEPWLSDLSPEYWLAVLSPESGPVLLPPEYWLADLSPEYCSPR